MKKSKTKRRTFSLVEICNHCSKPVSFSSDLFVNRVHVLNDIFTRIANRLKYSLGDFVCRDCDKLTTEI